MTERGCTYGRNRGPCSKSLDFQDIIEHRMQCVELTAELDLVILTMIRSDKNFIWYETLKDKLFFKGQQVCRNTFQFLHGVGKEGLANLKKHLRKNGSVAWRHGNTS